jgi:hypothetical protein
MQGDVSALNDDAVVNHEKSKAARECAKSITYGGTSDSLSVRLNEKHAILGKVGGSLIQAAALPHIAYR